MANKERIVLAVDTSGGPAGCAAVCCPPGRLPDARVLSSAAVDVGLTHSQTLMPLLDGVLKNAGLSLDDIGLLAVAAGPGSFTGVRIGIAAVKGMALAREIPCAGVSTLAALARGMGGLPFEGIVLAALDARCQQVYAAAFESRGGVLSRLTPDEALPVEELAARFVGETRSVLTLGDGASLCCAALRDKGVAAQTAPLSWRPQQSVGVALEGALAADNGCAVSCDALLPSYLRLPQAERELRARQKAEFTMS